MKKRKNEIIGSGNGAVRGAIDCALVGARPSFRHNVELDLV
jgi:hypothetical protein